jgi:hypothetical protein
MLTEFGVLRNLRFSLVSMGLIKEPDNFDALSREEPHGPRASPRMDEAD